MLKLYCSRLSAGLATEPCCLYEVSMLTADTAISSTQEWTSPVFDIKLPRESVPFY